MDRKSAKRWLVWLAAGLAVAAARMAAAAITIPDGVPWVYDVADYGQARILHGPGCGDVAIPSELDGYPVRRIGDGAFRNCKGLTSVSIPDSVTDIGPGAFDGCDGRLFDTNTLPGVVLLDGWAVGHAGDLSGKLVLTDIRGIAGNAFQGCSGLTEVTIPASARGIGSNAFSGCTGLEIVCMPTTWTDSMMTGAGVPSTCTILRGEAWETVGGTVWAYAVENGEAQITDGPCEGDVVIPAVLGGYPVTTFAGGWLISLFGWSEGLTSVIIPEGITSIPEFAFQNCRALTNLTIPDSVTDIGHGAFSGSGLKTLYMPESWKWKTQVLVSWSWSALAGVPGDCQILYYNPEGNTSSTPVAVPHAWLARYVPEILAEKECDFEAAASATAANGKTVWECYAAGLSPTDPHAAFTAEIDFGEDGPRIQWNPDLNENGSKSGRVYTVEGKAGMTDEWDATNAASRFFRVKVDMPE